MDYRLHIWEYGMDKKRFKKRLEKKFKKKWHDHGMIMAWN